jgi:hypothetical protein
LTLTPGNFRSFARAGAAVLVAAALGSAIGAITLRAQFQIQSPTADFSNLPPKQSELQKAAEEDVARAQKEVAALITAQADDFPALSAADKEDTIIVNAALVYERVVKQRLENVGLGCHEGEVALMAWFDYWRSLQEAGIEDNPAVFPIVDGTPRHGSFDLPDRIFETIYSRCLTEAYDRCVATGDFPRIFVPLVAMQRVWERFLGRKIPSSWIDAFVRDARLCGQWQLRIATDFDVTGPPNTCCTYSAKVHRDIALHWEPNGFGIGNIYNSTVDGDGDIVVDALSVKGICKPTTKPATATEKAKARLRGLVFKELENGTSSPRHVWLQFNSGQANTAYTLHCPGRDVGPIPYYVDGADVEPVLVETARAAPFPDEDPGGLLILDNKAQSSDPDTPSAWRFAAHPFRADLTIDETTNDTVATHHVHVTIRLTHTPH